jgi:hypothetical protein
LAGVAFDVPARVEGEKPEDHDQEQFRQATPPETPAQLEYDAQGQDDQAEQLEGSAKPLNQSHGSRLLEDVGGVTDVGAKTDVGANKASG